MENSQRTIGSRGLIKRHEFVRTLVQCLYSLGYDKAASCLELESGVSYNSAEHKLLEKQVLEGNWDGCINSLDNIVELSEGARASALFLVFKQCLVEYLCRGDDVSALRFLRKQISSRRVDPETVRNLALLFFSLTSMGTQAGNDVGFSKMRKTLFLGLDELLPPEIVLPEKRLEYLIHFVVNSQIDSCMFHNSQEPVSLYQDHCCSSDQIPSETVQILTEHRNEVWFVQFSNNGEYLASSSKDRTAMIWKVHDDGMLKHKHTLIGYDNPVSFLAWSPDDSKLLTCGNPDVLKLWDVETGTCKHTFGHVEYGVRSCAWFPNSYQLVSGSSDPEMGICVWDCEGSEIKSWRGTRIPKVVDLALTPDGQHLISVVSDKELWIMDFGSNVERTIVEEQVITSMSMSGDGKSFIVCLNSQEIHLWDVADNTCKPCKYFGHTQHNFVIRSCFGGLNSAFIASGSEDCKVYIWNRRQSTPVKVLFGHSKTVNCVAWNPKRHQMMASASDDETIRIWGAPKS